MAARESQDLPRRIADLDGQDAYALLGVPPDAAPEEISAAYRREMARAHPDRGGSARRAQAVNCAFDVLSRYRDDYDLLTAQGSEPVGLDVLHVEPDVEPLDEAERVRRRLRPQGLGLVAAGLAVVAAVAFAVVTLDRATRAPAPDPAAAWTTSQAGPASLPAPQSGFPSSGVPSSGVPSAGDSWTVPSPPPAATAVVASASATGADGPHRCEVRADASLWCAGANAHGQLGVGSARDAVDPVRVGAQDRWAAVAVGGSASCGLHTDGSLWCWGDNSFGQVGDGTNSARDTPVPVEPTARWLALDVDRHACAVRADHSLWCWGAGQQGELGDAGGVDRATPVRVGGEAAWTTVSVGAGWTCGVRQDGSGQCWGAPVRR